ncbi:MAG TPA: hypothetical protein VEX41_00500 [Candidatus Eisenbacteria bacterium]|nr:hypothetical protein [Candidatus Eisenbacteria bacterium]
MAIYQGARPSPTFGLLPWSRSASRRDAPVRRPARRAAAHPAAARPRPRGATARRVRRGPSWVGFVLTAIVFVFAAAFLSLSQSVRVAATSYDIIRLGAEQDRLGALRQDARSDVERLRGGPAIRKGALDLGLGQLGTPVVVPAR